LFTIFETLDDMTSTGNCDARFSRVMLRAGRRDATEKLEYIDSKIAEANHAPDELKNASCRSTAS
jgi:hypothetical protein